MERTKVINRIKQVGQATLPPRSSLLLYGSRARGDARRDSDWDVLILLDKERITPQDIDDYGYPLWELGLDYNESVNTILYTKKEWRHDAANPFVENVTADGIRLWG